MTTDAQDSRPIRTNDPLLPLAYFSTGYLAILLLLQSMLKGHTGGDTLGAALILVLAVGTFMRQRWTMVASICIGGSLGAFALAAWTSGTTRSPLILAVLAPVIVLTNALVLYRSFRRQEDEQPAS